MQNENWQVVEKVVRGDGKGGGKGDPKVAGIFCYVLKCMCHRFGPNQLKIVDLYNEYSNKL